MERARRPRFVASALLAASAALFPVFGICLEAEEPPRPNILLVVMDATRPDHLGCYGYGLPTSPNIDRIAGEGIVFDNAVAQAPWTKASFSSFLTSRYPFETGVTDWYTMLPDTIITLQEILVANGYQTACVLNMAGMAERWNLFRGFEERSIIKRSEGMVDRTTARSLNLIRRFHQPFFAMIHYYHTHAPYMPSKEFRALFVDDPTARHNGLYQQELYDACIREVDAEMGEILEFLTEQGLDQNTIIVITADHGEAFGEHGHFGHGWSPYDEEIRVPLILRCPARYPGGQRIEAQVRLIDLMPTLLGMAGLEVPVRCEGSDRLNPPPPDAASSHFFPARVAYSSAAMREEVPPARSVRTARWKLMVEPMTGLISAYDLKADPGETLNLWPSDAAPLDSLLVMLRAVPGFSPRGWRLAFTDQDRRITYEAQVSLPGGGRIVNVRKKSNTGFFQVETSKDGNSMRVTAETQDLNMLFFNTEPRGAELEITVTAEGEGAPVIHAGRQASHKAGEAFSTTSSSAQGLPLAFQQSRDTRTAAAFIWWMPGDEAPASRPAATLSPEEKQRLKSLGYIR
jgi:choline-sulfatase